MKITDATPKFEHRCNLNVSMEELYALRRLASLVAVDFQQDGSMREVANKFLRQTEAVVNARVEAFTVGSCFSSEG